MQIVVVILRQSYSLRFFHLKLCFIITVKKLFLTVIYFLRDRARGEGQRERESITDSPSRLQALRCQHGAQHGAGIHGPQDRNLSGKSDA